MKTDEIIEMARQAGMYQDLNVSFNQSIQNFAKLVATKEREEISQMLDDFELHFTADIIRSKGEE